MFKYVVYKITFPNGKIYVGKDEGGTGHSLRYFGSWSNALVAQDFSNQELRNFTLTKEILFESDSKEEVRRMESEMIMALRCGDPAIGYNRTHRPDQLRWAKSTQSPSSGDGGQS
ncbi:GIY-YIG nuclease family protein [Cupriavidus sp. AcVe19-1a]|uniref:GIY-YIG nuclease family protein n=1 Tax=Cupriavidus sp. AcVe19-1a TaxID=2821359 RepID=UPI001AE4F5A4|nr:GIY-YIG nuclease family protein [Cupriavidus sp. AcVe19-1a]MBP0633341.1 GIY-YIG nuclease family protein [Cupriavidus sp. AcVe19-1a]